MISPEEIKALMAKDTCPFCGWHTPSVKYEGMDRYKIMCPACGGAGGICKGESAALGQWNLRAYLPALSTLQTLLNQAGEALHYTENKLTVIHSIPERLPEIHYELRKVGLEVEKALAAIQPYLEKPPTASEDATKGE